MAIEVGVQSIQLRPWVQAGPEPWLPARRLVTRPMVALAVGVAAAAARRAVLGHLLATER
jgi:hypothetical protein